MYPPFVDKEYIKIYVRLDWNIAMRAKAVGTILREHTTSQDCRLVCLGAICVTLEENKNPKSDYVSLFVGWVTCVRRWNTTKSNYLHIALWVQFVRLWTNTKAECARIVCLAALCATLENTKFEYVLIVLWLQVARLWKTSKSDYIRIVFLGVRWVTLENYNFQLLPHRVVGCNVYDVGKLHKIQSISTPRVDCKFVDVGAIQSTSMSRIVCLVHFARL
jgi:hypothetical protein